jgi:5'-nucleotidase (lipoprotein e(P4) family)
MNTIRSVALALSLAALSACGTSGGVRSPMPGQEPSTAGAVDRGTAHDNLNAVIWMQTAAEYEAATRSVFGSATEILDRALADPTWDALPREERGGQRVESLLPAIIVDADETVIDNSPYQARLIEREETFDAATWREWTEARRATAIPGALEFLRAAAQRGVTVFYVTNRATDAKTATYDNLKALGFPLSEPEDTVLTIDEAQGWASAKGTRRQFVGERYRVLMMLGDNLGDFVDGHAAPVAVRAALMEPYRGWWGLRWFMLPNPSYGGWEGAITRDATDPNRAKRSVLRTRY